MLLAVPFIISVAASRSLVFRSGSFVSAMPLACSTVILPTSSLFGSPEPFTIPAAFFMSSEAGGVLDMKE